MLQETWVVSNPLNWQQEVVEDPRHEYNEVVKKKQHGNLSESVASHHVSAFRWLCKNSRTLGYAALRTSRVVRNNGNAMSFEFTMTLRSQRSTFRWKSSWDKNEMLKGMLVLGTVAFLNCNAFERSPRTRDRPGSSMCKDNLYYAYTIIHFKSMELSGSNSLACLITASSIETQKI